MINILIFILFSSFAICLLLFMISLFFVESDVNETSETAFECGFEPFFFSRIPFSIHFFTITIVFLIFDLEIVILLPIVFKISNMISVLMMTVLMILLIIGLVVEWYDNSLSWQMS